MNETEKLVHIEAIKRLKARYFQALDFKRWSDFRTIFCDDVSCDYRGAATDPMTGVNAVPGATEDVIVGADRAIEALQRGLQSVVTVHGGHSPDIEIHTPVNASGIWGMSDILCFPPSGPIVKMVGYGHYHEVYQRVDDLWRIKSLKLTRLLVNISSSA